MKKQWGKQLIALGTLGLFLSGSFGSTAWAKSEAYFNKPVDKRFAWLNNDARGNIDFQAKIVELINSAEKSVDVCTMSFGGVNAIADALAVAAGKGIRVRIIGNSGYRFGEGFQRALRGSVQIADNNLPSLVCRINFQKKDSPVPENFLPDYGDVYGDRGNGHAYGWTLKSAIEAQKTDSTEYTSSLLRDVFIIRNNKESAKWQIKLPNGYYYVLVNVGRHDNYDKENYFNYIKVQGKEIFTYKKNQKLHYSDYKKTKPGEFSCSVVEGGTSEGDKGQIANSQRLQVTDGKLTLTVGGNNGYNTYTALNFIEIYRASPTQAYGDNGTDKKYVQERQLQHSKYMLIDGGTPKARLWTGSGNMTAAMSYLSEDAILTDEKEICDAFYEEFNHMWGGKQFVPDPDKAAFGRFKTAMNTADFSISNSYFYPTGSFLWQAHFSPSRLPDLNLYTDLSRFIGGAKHNLIMLMEQWTPSGDINASLSGSTSLLKKDLGNYINSGKPFYGLFGNSNAGDPIFTYFAKYSNAHIKQVETIKNDYGIHNKIALADAYRDTRYAKRGALLFGSMNWSQSGMHSNDEQTLIVKDPALANQYLQRAMAALGRENMMPVADTDIILVLDRSASMQSKTADNKTTKLDAMKSAAKLFVDLLASDGKHRISIVRFGDGVESNKNESTGRLETLTPQHAMSVKEEIDSITTSGRFGNWTCYGSALQAALNRFNAVSPKSRRIILFFTDGMENKAPMAKDVYQSLVDANIEIHSTAFGSFSPFSSGEPTAVLADMAYKSAGSFAQMDEDPIKLKKRFAEIAGDIMNASTILDPAYELTAKSPTVKIEIPEIMDSFQVLQLDEADSSISVASSVEPVAVKKSMRLIEKEKYAKGQSYQLLKFKQNNAKIKKHFPEIEFKLKQEVLGKNIGKMYVVILAHAPTTIKAEAVAVQAGQKDITLLCRMLQNNRALANATVTAEWTTPVSAGKTQTTEIKLYDDGRHGDGQANDGLFGTPLKLNEVGNHTFHIVGIASGDKRNGIIRQKIESKKKELLSFKDEVRSLKNNKEAYLEQKSDLKQQKLLLKREVRMLEKERKEYAKKERLLQSQRIRREITVYYTVNK